MSRMLDRAWLREAPVLTTEEHSPRLYAISDWLTEQGLLRASFGTLLEGYCERLLAVDVPLWRGFISARTLHPTVRGTGCSWRAGEGIRSELYIYGPQQSDDYVKSPFRWMIERGEQRLRLDLSGHRAGARSRWSSGCGRRAPPTISRRSWASASTGR